MKSIHNLVPFVNKDNEFIITFPEYVKDYCNNNLYLDSYSFVSVIGKPGPTKFKVLNNLFSLDSTLNQEELQQQRINISQSHYASHFIHDVNLQGFDLYLEKEYKAVLFAFLTSTHIILILEQEDLKLLNIRKLLTILIMHYWATKDEGTHLKKLTFLVDSSTDVINYLANYESFMEDLKNTWSEVFKPPGMEQTSLYDVIELDFKSFTQHELENRPAASKLLELSLLISSPTKKKASLLTAAISSLTSSVVSPLKSADGMTSPTLQRTKKAPYPFELFQIYYDELWQGLKGTLTMPDLYDINCAQRKNNLLETEFKREKDEIYNKVEYEILELRQRVESEYVIFDFQHVGMRIYDDAISKLLSLEYRSSLEYLFDGNDKLRNEKRLLAERIVTELHELYQTQASYLKENVLSDLKSRMNFNKKRPEKEYGFKLATIFSREQEKLLHEVEETLNGLQVHIHEPGLTQKWETEPYLVDIKRSLKDFREKYLEEEVNKYLQSLIINTRRSLKQTVTLKNLDFDLWEEVQATFISIVQENDENLSQFLEANTKLMKATIKEKVFDFRKDCFEYILSLLREEVTEFGSTLFNNFEIQFKEICKKQENVWYSQGPSVAFDNLDQSSQAISKKILNRLDQLRYVQIEQEFFEKTLDSLNYPRVFISEIKYNQLYKQFFDRVHIHVEAQKKKLRKKFKYDERKQFRHEFIFWMVWIFVLYFFFCYPGLTPFFLLLASAGVKGISYSGILKNLGLTNITAKVQQIYKESPIKSSATKLKKN